MSTMSSFLADLRHGFRILVRSPGFTLVAVLSLAAGIGANTAIFSLVNSLLFRPLPFERADELISVFTSDFSGPAFGASSYPDYLDFKTETRVVGDLAAEGPLQGALVVGDRTERVTAILATGNYFELLGVGAAAGRTFAPADDAPGAEPVAVLSDRFWRRIGADASIIGKPVAINGQPFTVSGIAPPGFTGALPVFDPDLWIPAATIERVSSERGPLGQRGSRRWMLIGRLARGATLAQARVAFSTLSAQLAQQYPAAWLDLRQQPRRISITSPSRVPQSVRGVLAGFMALLMSIVGLVLLIACANVANLLLARAAGRTREVAVRLALGAGRGRLVRQLLTESLVLSLVAGGAGLVLAYWLTRAIAGFTPPVPLPLALDTSIDLRVLLFAAAISVATGIVFGLVPAVTATRSDLVPALKSEVAWVPTRRRLMAGQALVVTQVAMSLLLLVAAGLFIRTLQQSQRVEIGFDPDRVAVAGIDLSGMRPASDRSELYYQALLDRLGALPGVEHASLAALVPLGLGSSRRSIAVEGYQFRPGEDTEQHVNVVSPDFFATLRIPIVKGRAFAASDRANAPPVVMINETFARRFWPNEEPIGKRIKVSGPNGLWSEVVGVTKDGHYVNLLAETLPYFFMPLAQSLRPSVTVFVRARTDDPARLLPVVRNVVRELNTNVSTFEEGLLADRIAVGLLPMQIAASALGLFGTLALALAAVGLYGVLAHGVSQRRREIGVRVALGAEPRAVQTLFVLEGMRIVGIGIALGWAAAIGLTRLLSSFLYGVSPTDPTTFAGTTVLLAIVALAATYFPARRAARLDPIRALHQD